jgi:hypothetical protein
MSFVPYPIRIGDGKRKIKSEVSGNIMTKRPVGRPGPFCVPAGKKNAVFVKIVDLPHDF